MFEGWINAAVDAGLMNGFSDGTFRPGVNLNRAFVPGAGTHAATAGITHRIAAFDAKDVERLMGDAAIVRNRAKIEATITNARAMLDLDSLDELVRVGDRAAAEVEEDAPAGV